MTDSADITIQEGKELVSAEQLLSTLEQSVTHPAITEDEKTLLAELGLPFVIVKADQQVSKEYADNVFMIFTIVLPSYGTRVLFMGKNEQNAALYDSIYDLCKQNKAVGPWTLEYIQPGTNKEGVEYRGFYRLNMYTQKAKIGSEHDNLHF